MDFEANGSIVLKSIVQVMDNLLFRWNEKFVEVFVFPYFSSDWTPFLHANETTIIKYIYY